MAQFKKSFEVCNCKHVILGEIIHAIKEKDAKTVKAIGDITDAGTVCGCCKSIEDDIKEPKMKLHLTQILNKFAS